VAATDNHAQIDMTSPNSAAQKVGTIGPIRRNVASGVISDIKSRWLMFLIDVSAYPFSPKYKNHRRGNLHW
jgi:hypothetical protein